MIQRGFYGFSVCQMDFLWITINVVFPFLDLMVIKWLSNDVMVGYGYLMGT